MKRSPEEPAFVLHRYDWSESSLILEVFTRRHGRVALAAKGAKRPHSALRPVLLPMQPLHISFSGESEVRTLKTAEWVGGQAMPSGRALLTGYYVNELVLRLLAREDPHEALFDHYAALVRLVGGDAGLQLQAGLRAFELSLLKEIGLLPALDMQTSTGDALRTGTLYRLIPESGLREAADPGDGGLPGAQWLQLHAGLSGGQGFERLVDACLPLRDALRPQLRELLHYHCGGRNLRTRDMLMELREL
jgi:DNA repair protein RecO (recombination protein O)